MYALKKIRTIKYCSICGEEDCEEILTFENENLKHKTIKISQCDPKFENLDEILEYINS